MELGLGLLGVFVLVALVRWSVARAVKGPIFVTDDLGYLLAARYFADVGAPPHHLFGPFYHAGYSLLTAPAFLITDAPYDAFATIQMFNVILGASLVFPLYLLARYPFQSAFHTSLLVALAAGVYSGATIQTAVAWPENVLPVLIAWMLVALSRIASSARWPALATGLLCATMTLTHPRLVPLALIVAVLVTVGLLRHWLTLTTWLLTLLPGIALTALGAMVNRSLRRDVYEAPGIEPVSSSAWIIEGVLDPAHYLVGLTIAAGQLWHLTAATLGLSILAVLYTVHKPRTGNWTQGEKTAPDTAQIIGGVALTGTASVVALGTALFMRMDVETARADQFIYGRYTDPFMPVLIMIGLIALPEARRLVRSRLAVGAGLSVIAVTLWLVVGPHADLIAERFVWPVAVPAVLVAGPIIQDSFFGFDVGVVSLWAGTACVFIIALARFRPHVASLCVAAWFIVSATVATESVVKVFAANQAARITLPVAINALDSAPGPIAYDRAAHSAYGLSAYQFRVPNREFIVYDSRQGERPGPRTRLVIASGQKPPTGPDDRLIARETTRDQALWLSTPPTP